MMVTPMRNEHKVSNPMLSNPESKKPIAIDGLRLHKEPYGAGKEARTLDLYLGKVSLYQLSYSRMGDPKKVKEKPITKMG